MTSHFPRAPILSMLLFSVTTDSDDNSDNDDSSTTPLIVADQRLNPARLLPVRLARPFMFALLIGMAMMIGGFATRMLSANPATKNGNNVATIALTLLAVPTLGPEVASKTMFIAPTRVATIFVCTDVTTFLIKAVGGALLASSALKTNILGTRLLLQLVSFGLFIRLAIVFAVRLYVLRSMLPPTQRFTDAFTPDGKHFTYVWKASTRKPNFGLFGRNVVNDRKVLYYTLCITCIALLIRSIFRVAEFATGFHSALSTEEAYVYCLDTLPVWVAMSMYCVVWPPRFLVLPSQQPLRGGLTLEPNNHSSSTPASDEASYVQPSSNREANCHLEKLTDIEPIQGNEESLGSKYTPTPVSVIESTSNRVASLRSSGNASVKLLHACKFNKWLW
ncbi:RTA1 like protein-domain-containing protein [Mycena alexandri]|uniref:RTA1 like protein-domain-containing protein n=1 Tax=Mycena alexandri TaxID=1745969 RepID=A0AAD6SGN9_9AGAR|nr:RTA1 like protein-domain-containing protein [Mycena alexandri]